MNTSKFVLYEQRGYAFFSYILEKFTKFDHILAPDRNSIKFKK